MTPIRTILCPVDFSAPSEEAARYAVSLADRLGAESVHLLHAYRPPTHSLPEGTVFLDADADVSVREYLARKLENMAQRFSGHGVAVETHLVEGVAYRAIVEHVKAQDAQLVVIGTHGRSGLKHLLLGSVAEKVVRVSPVPVCTVHAPA
jgi:nucleotide-binding universal stress UspA family protein